MSGAARMLPTVDIGGIPFYVDIRLNELRQADNFMNRINLDDLGEKNDGGYVCCFDPVTRNLFNGGEKEYHSRNDLVEVVLPSLSEMDPTGFERCIEKWKEDNPLVAAALMSIPEVVANREDRTCEQSLLPKHPINKGKGNHL